MRGYCETLERGPRHLALTGWAADAAFVPGVRLRVRIGDAIVADAAIGRARARDDLQALGASAFHVVVRAGVPAGVPLDVVLAAGDAEHPLRRFAPADMIDATPRGHLDLLDATRLRGWVADPAGWRLGTPPRLLVGTLAIDLPLNEERCDLGVDAPEGIPLGFDHSWSWVVAQLRGLDPGFVLDRPLPVAIEASGVEVARVRHHHRPRLRGRVERLRDGRLAGWGVDEAWAHEPLPVDLLLDGVRYDSGLAAGERADLRAKGLVPAGGGFRFALPPAMPGETGEPALAVRAALGAGTLDAGAVGETGAGLRRRDRGGLLHTLPAGDAPGITVVVPIHRAAEDVARCIDALVRNTGFPARLLLIDDGSDDPAIDALLARAATLPNVVVEVQANRGFTATCNRGIAMAGRDDVVLLNSDTMVTPGWLEGLRVAAYSEAGVATVTPLSDNAGAFSVPEHNAANRAPAGFDHDDQARLVRHASLSLMPAMPTGNGFCLYVRRDALDRIGALDEAAFPRGYGEENDLCMRAWRAGMLNLVDDRSYVHHRRSVSFGAEKTRNMAAGRAVVDERYPEYRLLTRQFRDDPDMLAIRWRVRRAMMEAKAPPRPRVLFVISTTSGGTPQTNADLMAALADRYEPWVLRCDSRSLELSRWSPEGSETVETRRLERPIHAAVHRSGEYDGIVADLLVRHGFELVHIRHLAWHGLGLPEVCRRLGVPTVFSFHDFYTVCPTTKLLDDGQRFCGGRCTAGDGHCAPELWPDGSLPALKHRFVGRWREMMAPAIAACDAFVTTSPGARDTMVANYPDLAARDFRVIPHARDFGTMEALAALPSSSERLRVLVPGNISAAKGAKLLAAIAGLDTDHAIEFHILGDPGRVPAGPGVVHHGRYARGEFAEAVRRIRPHLGAILSIWPETYSHTLTEMWAAGLPVAALDTGAVGERIAETGAGWLFPPDSDPQALLDALLAIRGDRMALRARTGRVADWQSGTGRTYDTAAMAARYDRLYRRVMRRRLAFAGPPAEEVPVVLTCAGSDGGGPHASLARRTANAVGRTAIFRHVPADFAWEDADLAGSDAILVALAALPAHVLPALAARVAGGSVPLVVAVDGEPATPAQWALLERARLVLTGDAATAGLLAARGVATGIMAPRIDPAAWTPAYRPQDGAVRVRVTGDMPAVLAALVEAGAAVPAEDAADLLVIADGGRQAPTGLPCVDMAEDGAGERLAELVADPLARDRAALAAWAAIPPDAWLSRRGDPLDALLLEAIRPVEAEPALKQAA